MPHTHKRTDAERRAAYTGEKWQAAKPGLGRKRGLGLDDATTGQIELRSLLALAIFNTAEGGAPTGWWGVHTITCYDVVMSPRYGALMLITNAPDNIADGRLLPKPDRPFALPGLRVRAVHSSHDLVLEHIPTGGILGVTSNKKAQLNMTGRPDGKFRSCLTPADPLMREEETALAGVPPRTPAAHKLLGALTTRLHLRCPKGKWAVGRWDYDPLSRVSTEVIDRTAFQTPWRRLWGAGDHWRAEWYGLPHTEDLVHALTDPVAGLSGARGQLTPNGAVIEYGTAVLELHPRDQRLRQ